MTGRSQYWKERSRKRREDPAYREKQAIWNKRWREKNGCTTERLARKAEQQKRYRSDQSLRPRHEARWAVNRAIASGKLIRQACEVCGDYPTEAHHDDYSRPLDIRWLCTRCHTAQHIAAKATGRAALNQDGGA